MEWIYASVILIQVFILTLLQLCCLWYIITILLLKFVLILPVFYYYVTPNFFLLSTYFWLTRYSLCRFFFSAHSKFRTHTTNFVQAESNLRLLLVWLCLVKLTMGVRYYHLPFKRQVRNKDSRSKKLKSLLYPFPLFKAILIGFCFCTEVAAHFPGVLARGKDRVRLR